MSCGKVWSTALAVAAVVSALALASNSSDSFAAGVPTAAIIIAIVFLYVRSWRAGGSCQAGTAEPSGVTKVIRALDKTLEGEAADLSGIEKDAADALSRVAERLEWLTREINEMSPSDELTSLAKEEVFNNVLWREFNRALRYKASVSVALVEVGNLDQYRDKHDSEAAEELVREVASVILQMVRETDLAARYGRDTFAVIMPETGAPGAVEFSQRLRTAVNDALSKKAGDGSEVKVSVGVASVPSEEIKTAPELVERAAQALESAKSEK